MATLAGSIGLTSSPTFSAVGRLSPAFASINPIANGSMVIAGSFTPAFSNVVWRAVPAILFGGRIYSSIVARTTYDHPPAPHDFQLVAQRILDRKIVDWDLPVADDFEYTRTLSGPTVMTGSFKPEIISVQELNLDGYSYFLHVVISGQVRASAILLPPQYDDSSLTFTAEGLSAAPHYTPFTGILTGIQLDPMSIIRQIWNHVQSNPRSSYGVAVSSLTTDVKLGTPPTPQSYNDRSEAANKIASRMESSQKIYEDWTWANCPPVVANYNDELLKLWRNAGRPTVPQWLRDFADANPKVNAKPYELVWWDTPNCGEEIDALVTQTPLDYRERSQFNTAMTDITHNLDFGYPRIGAPRPNLVFDNENILELVPVQEDQDSYASEVIVIGAGEGAATIRGFASTNFGDRIRKTHVHTDKTITDQVRANAIARDIQRQRAGIAFEIAEIVLDAKHPNAPVGSYDVGDDIVVSVDIPWLMETYIAWYRITSITSSPSTTRARLGLTRSIT